MDGEGESSGSSSAGDASVWLGLAEDGYWVGEYVSYYTAGSGSGACGLPYGNWAGVGNAVLDDWGSDVMGVAGSDLSASGE